MPRQWTGVFNVPNGTVLDCLFEAAAVWVLRNIANPEMMYASHGMSSAGPSSGQLLSAGSKRPAHYNTQPDYGISQRLISAASPGNPQDIVPRPAQEYRKSQVAAADVPVLTRQGLQAIHDEGAAGMTATNLQRLGGSAIQHILLGLLVCH